MKLIEKYLLTDFEKEYASKQYAGAAVSRLPETTIRRGDGSCNLDRGGSKATIEADELFF